MGTSLRPSFRTGRGARGHGPVHASPCRLLACSAALSRASTSAACSTPRYTGAAHRDISVRITDPLFEAHRWTANLRILEIDEIKTVPRVPMSHPFVERLIGTMRREFLDQVLFWNARDLERKLAEFQVHYNAARCHASLEGHTPQTFASGHTAVPANLNHVRWVSHCRGPRPAPRRRLMRIRDGQADRRSRSEDDRPGPKSEQSVLSSTRSTQSPPCPWPSRGGVHAV